VLDLLAHLVDQSLVVAEERGGETRYRFLETIQEYAGEQLREAGEEAATALAARFGSSDPSGWRQPRPMYDVTVTGLAPKPQLKFYDRGTWQQAVELGP
jgi:hypothetical protein